MPLGSLLRDVVDLFYPGVCASCSAACAGREFLCPRCSAELDVLASSPACGRCALPLATPGVPCPWCGGGGFHPFTKVVSLGTFHEPLRTLIHGMKYHRRWPLAEAMADWLLAEERVKGLLAGADVLVPVPLHWSRQIRRGYNQADVLASVLARRCRLKVARPVARVRDTPSQTAQPSPTARMANVHRAFELRRRRWVTGKHVVVVDDVMTTAATLQAVGRALKPARPASLCAVVLAVADPKGRDFEAV